MKNLPAKDADKGTNFTVADFLEAGRDRLKIKLVAGAENVSKVMAEPIVNRLGLALTGFFGCFAWKRLQLVGNAEWAYLTSLSDEERTARFRELTAHKAWLFVFTADRHASAEEIKIAEECGAVIMESPLKTRIFSRHATFIMEQLGAPKTSLYGTMIEVSGLGVLIEGDPGLGKSETALGLIKRGNALIADDLTCIRKDVATNFLFASASDSTAGFMEIRGIGIMNVSRVFGVNAVRGEKRLQLVLTLKRLDDIKGEVDRIGQNRRARTILGVDVPNIIIPVSEGRDLVNLVETAAQQQKLILAGYDPVADLSDHLHRRAQDFKVKKGKAKTNGR